MVVCLNSYRYFLISEIILSQSSLSKCSLFTIRTWLLQVDHVHKEGFPVFCFQVALDGWHLFTSLPYVAICCHDVLDMHWERSSKVANMPQHASINVGDGSWRSSPAYLTATLVCASLHPGQSPSWHRCLAKSTTWSVSYEHVTTLRTPQCKVMWWIKEGLLNLHKFGLLKRANKHDIHTWTSLLICSVRYVNEAQRLCARIKKIPL